ncbi:MAG: site-specific integrase [Ruminococcus sp.]|nr:site-specific integrase [Ruminococcus sp.]
MANITPRKNKSGEIVSYRIRVARGYTAQGEKLKPYERTWKPDKGMTKRQVEKELNRQAALFEEQCKQGLTGDSKQKFGAYAAYVLDLKEQRGELRHHTVVRYRELLKRINAGIGHIKLQDLRPQHLNQLYEQLGKNGLRKDAQKAIVKDGVKLSDMIHKAGFSNVELFLKEQVHLSVATYRNAANGKSVTLESANKLATALDTDVKKLFNLVTDSRPLSSKTVREHHVLIHLILEQAVREMIIPFNTADRATPPKADKPKANYFEQDEITAILQAAESIPLKWKTILHLMLVTGGRRGEVLGLTWDCIDFTFSRIHIEKTVNYEADVGIYVDTTKTDKSTRWIKLPANTMQLLHQYKTEYYDPLRTVSSKSWTVIKDKNGMIHNDFLFVQDSGENIGAPMHPDSVTGYCNNFSDKYNLKHINPHAFRHSAASLLYFAGMDTISISSYLGHAAPSTTQNLYAHVMQEAESRIAAAMGEIVITQRIQAIRKINRISLKQA